uniref:Putative secreted protein n=1 Tax=Anopheles darlingi TaxID=43151 RepID=A0A2M4DFN1_ANODA
MTIVSIAIFLGCLLIWLWCTGNDLIVVILQRHHFVLRDRFESFLLGNLRQFHTLHRRRTEHVRHVHRFQLLKFRFRWFRFLLDRGFLFIRFDYAPFLDSGRGFAGRFNTFRCLSIRRFVLFITHDDGLSLRTRCGFGFRW